jgi:hypothetical protein
LLSIKSSKLASEADKLPYRACDGDISACCAAIEAGASEGAVEAIVVE